MLTLSKNLKLTRVKTSKPTSDELELINHYTLIEVSEENIYVRKSYLAHNAIDRDGDVFDDQLLSNFANTLPGKGLFRKHPLGFDGDTGPGVGRWFYASVLDVSLDEARELLKEPKLKFPPSTERAKILETGLYVPKTEQYKGLIEDIDYGIAGDVSIGFNASDRAPITDGTTEHVIASRILGPGEALEGSLVWLGAQPGARVHKQASLIDDDDEQTKEADEMDKKDLDALQLKLTTESDAHVVTKAALAVATKDAGILAAVKSALGDAYAALLDTPAVLVEKLKAADEGHKTLVADVIAAERLAGFIGDKDEDVVTATKEYTNLDDARLKMYLEKAKTHKPGGGSQIAGGDPNATDAQQQKTEDQKDASSPFENAGYGKKAAA